MQCVILAGGKGVRMRPLTDTTPKPLVLISGVSLLEHIVATLPPAVDELVIVVKYLADRIRTACGDTLCGIPVRYAVQTLPDGTGGALLAARPFLRDRFFTLPADDLHGAEALQQLATHDIALLGAVAENPRRFGVLDVSPEGALLGIDEKPAVPKSNLVNTGAMVLDMRIFSYETPEIDGEVRLTDMVTLLARDVPVPVVSQPTWCPVGTPEDIPRAEAFVRTHVRHGAGRVVG